MATTNRVLVTGASGFTGRWVTSELGRSGLAPVSFEEAEHLQSAPQVDLRDQSSLLAALDSIRPAAVIHLAAISFVAHGNAEDFWEINVEGSRNLLRALHETNCKPDIVIMASSANIYGNSAAGIVSEREPPRPANRYAESKLAMEKMAAEWMDTLPITLTRPFNYTGVGQAEHFLVPKIVAHFKGRAAKIELGNLDVARDFLDVRDVARIYVELLKARPAGETINICSGEAHTLQKLLKICLELTGHRPEIQVNPDFVRENEVKTLCGDPQKLRSLVGRLDRHPIRGTLSWMLDSD